MQETSPSSRKKMPPCLYPAPRTQTKPPLLPVTVDPSLCLVAGCWCTEEPGEHRLQNRRWRSERGLRAHRGVCRCTNTHLPRTRHGRCKSDLQRNAKVGLDSPMVATLTTSPLTSGCPSACCLLNAGMGRGGCARLPVPHALRAVLCLLPRHASCARWDRPQEMCSCHSPFSR